MLETITSIVVKYWVELLLGLVVTSGSFLIKRYIGFEKAERQKNQDEHYTKLFLEIQKDNKKLIDECNRKNQEVNQKLDERYEKATSDMKEALRKEREESKRDDQSLQGQINQANNGLNLLQSGILSIQGQMFKNLCHEVLNKDHNITLEEWEEIDSMHEVYNSLGGNHTGDYLYSLVSKKAEKVLTDIEEGGHHEQ